MHLATGHGRTQTHPCFPAGGGRAVREDEFGGPQRRGGERADNDVTAAAGREGSGGASTIHAQGQCPFGAGSQRTALPYSLVIGPSDEFGLGVHAGI
ncbi:hypothetical protein [Streptomyces sp. NBC_01443]|uniref:hypothetical protein n=1 Tax=Streptomyces sp. NBC_01443 TaxID=2903868 RepID=UPI0022542DD9|nr:hypothetical protein [Streptomyces sp. NBC_01443]MCX4625390.1 hypothetical protein [Streptomyces sp. NBC_01443]